MKEKIRSADWSVRPDSPLEWWFVQGYYGSGKIPASSFMVSLFRQRLEPASGLKNGFSLIASTLDHTRAESFYYHRVDPGVVELLLKTAGQAVGAGIDQTFVKAYLDEIKDYGPPRPVILETAPVSWSPGPLDVSWEGFSLRQEEGVFCLEFADPQDGRSCHFELAPFRPPLRKRSSRSMKIVTIPRLEIKGRAGNETVSGQGWLDHQWGGYGWFRSGPRGAQVLGWDWLGVNLENGTDLVVLARRDPFTGRILSQNALARTQGGRSVETDLFRLEPGKWWTSVKTGIRYPIEWRIVIPTLKADLVFKPLVEDQEIRILGPQRAIWEGAGSVSGRWSGKRTAGRGRLELNGYGYILDFERHMKGYIKDIDDCVKKFFPKTMTAARLRRYVGPPRWSYQPKIHTEMLTRPVWDLMERQGKRWRPLFARFMLEALGGNWASYRMMLSNISELSHTGAIIIDDIEDSSLLRRGAKTTHLRYGLPTAINAANTVYFLPYLLISEAPGLDDRQKLEIYRIVIGQFIQSHFGQGQDIYWSTFMNPENLARWRDESLDQAILQMYAFKTAAGVAGLAEAVCVIAGASPRARKACTDFGVAFGVSFQIMDDVHNFGDSPRWRKISGEDLAEGKLTYVIHKALQRLSPAASHRLQNILGSSELRSQGETLREGIGLVRSSGALAACRREALEMTSREWKRLSRFLPSSEPKIMLRVLCSSLLNLAFERGSAEGNNSKL